MYRLTSNSCQTGPCPLMGIDDDRWMALLQGYGVRAEHQAGLPDLPDGEVRIEMRPEVLEQMLAEHLTDEALARIVAMRQQ